MLTVHARCKKRATNNNMATGNGVYGLLAFHFRRNPASVKHTEIQTFPPRHSVQHLPLTFPRQEQVAPCRERCAHAQSSLRPIDS